MSPFISTASQVFLLVFACPRRNSYLSSDHNEKQREHDPQEEQAWSEVTIIDSEKFEKTDVYVETEEPPRYEDTLELTTLQKTSLARCTNLSIIHPKSYTRQKESEKPFVDPRDEEAARLAEEEDDLYVLKERATVGTQEHIQKPSRLQRLTSKLNSRPKKSRQIGRH